MKFTDKATIGQLDANGFLKVKARFARTGLQDYLARELDDSFPEKNDGSPYTIYRPESEVFSPESMKSLEGMDVTADAHEWQLPELEGQVSVGSVSGPVMRDGDFITGEILFKRKEAIDRVQNKDLVEISSAYGANTSPAKGEIEGKQYDGITRDIRYNHLTALPPGKGRAGPEVRITDKKEEEIMELINISTPYGNVKVDPASQQVVLKMMDAKADADAEKLKEEEEKAKLKDEKDQLEMEKEEKEKKMDSISSELEKTKGELDTTKQLLADAQSGENIQKAAQELSETQDGCKRIMGDAYPKDNKSTAKELKIIAARHFMTSKSMHADSNTTDDYLSAVYDTALSMSPNKTVKTIHSDAGHSDAQQRANNRLIGKKEAK